MSCVGLYGGVHTDRDRWWVSNLFYRSLSVWTHHKYYGTYTERPPTFSKMFGREKRMINNIVDVNNGILWLEKGLIAISRKCKGGSTVKSAFQKYTQSNGRRPFGLSTLLIGFDYDGTPKLYQTDPSGTYHEWKVRYAPTGKNMKLNASNVVLLTKLFFSSKRVASFSTFDLCFFRPMQLAEVQKLCESFWRSTTPKKWRVQKRNQLNLHWKLCWRLYNPAAKIWS